MLEFPTEGKDDLEFPEPDPNYNTQPSQPNSPSYPIQSWRPSPKSFNTLVENPVETTTYIHNVVIKEEENYERVYIKVSNPHLVNGDHIEYDVTIISNLLQHGHVGHSITVQKRYNDFYEFYLKVVELIGEDAKLMPEFPSVIWYNLGFLGFNLDPDVIQERMEKFNYFMTFIAKDRFLRVHKIVDNFFGISSIAELSERQVICNNNNYI
jgi:hypothetical protein